jgi:hypothetical protein
MKRSKKIQLVLVTALLASCDRVIIPEQTGAEKMPDSTLTAPVGPEDNVPCDCQQLYNPYRQYSYFDLNFGVYYYGQPYGLLVDPGHGYRKASFWNGSQFVVRGGFGKTNVLSSAS